MRNWTFRFGVPLFLIAATTQCGTVVAEVPLDGLGKTGETAVALKPGTKIGFSVSADQYSYSGHGAVIVEVQFLKDGKPSGNFSCPGFELEGGSGGGCGVTHNNSACEMTMPAPGATAVRVTTKLQGGSIEFTGLTVEVKTY